MNILKIKTGHTKHNVKKMKIFICKNQILGGKT